LDQQATQGTRYLRHIHYTAHLLQDSASISTLGTSNMKRTFGTLLLGAWLILGGLAHLLHLSFSGMGTLMAGLATASGILLVLGL
jgi:hypothetical protein